MDLRYWIKRFLLNVRVVRLLICRRIVSNEDVQFSYDRLAKNYNANWLERLQGMTGQLLQSIPDAPYAVIADLGCGTGFTTACLKERFPTARIHAVDISAGMLREAQHRSGLERIQYHRADMLHWLEQQPDNSMDLIVSAWAIGYSRYDRIMRQVSRVVRPGGLFVFVVNYRDTLAPVFAAVRHCMRLCHRQVARVALPRFPGCWRSVKRAIERCGLQVMMHDDGRHQVLDRYDAQTFLPWILNTGILAGFDQMLPFHTDLQVQAVFVRQVERVWQPLQHHYCAAIVSRPPSGHHL